jgi:hypothetical protein
MAGMTHGFRLAAPRPVGLGIRSSWKFLGFIKKLLGHKWMGPK